MHARRYTTTIHVINSCIVKAGKLTVASKVYRGVSGRVLPATFWQPNEFGVRGGGILRGGAQTLVLPRRAPERLGAFCVPCVYAAVESAFMSTTLDRQVALQYAQASDDAGPGFVFEIQQGMVDRGALIDWLSQYAPPLQSPACMRLCVTDGVVRSAALHAHAGIHMSARSCA